eukprot:5467477-Amphidinium_carterae.1
MPLRPEPNVKVRTQFASGSKTSYGLLKQKVSSLPGIGVALPLNARHGIRDIARPWWDIWAEHVEPISWDLLDRELGPPIDPHEVWHAIRDNPRGKALGLDDWRIPEWRYLPEEAI